jgi:tRNA (guanosine-2'-O-)-methyltransferase
MDVVEKQALYNFLCEYISPAKMARFQHVISTRTRHLTVVLEDIFQTQNASAVLRTAECLGIQDIHIIEDINKFSVNRDVARGAPKWLTLHRYRDEGGVNNTETCFKVLKEQGYRIVATSPHAQGHTIYNLPMQQKTALVFGTERKGLSAYALQQADDFVSIPILGFTESFNISVTAAIFLHHLVDKIHNEVADWHLPEAEKQDILLEWARANVHKVELLEKYFKSSLSNG